MPSRPRSATDKRCCGRVDLLRVSRTAREGEETAAAFGFSTICNCAAHIFGDGFGVVSLVLVDGSRFVAVERGIGELLPSLLKLGERVVEIEVVPEHCRGLEITVGLARVNLGHAKPVRCGFSETGAVGVDVTDAGQRVEIAGIVVEEMRFNGYGTGGIGRMEVSQGAIQRGCLATHLQIGWILGSERAGDGRAFLKVGLP